MRFKSCALIAARAAQKVLGLIDRILDFKVRVAYLLNRARCRILVAKRRESEGEVKESVRRPLYRTDSRTRRKKADVSDEGQLPALFFVVFPQEDHKENNSTFKHRNPECRKFYRPI